MLRYLTSGESHGPALVAIIEGLPANLPLQEAAINHQLWRRQQGHGRGYRMKIETDQIEFLSGVRFSKTMGSPVALAVHNKDHKNWLSRMAPTGDAPDDLARVSKPRPGHADLPGALKYEFDDMRNSLERASARNTATLVAVGAIARQLLDVFSISLCSHIVQIGPVKVDRDKISALSFEELSARAESSSVRCADPDAEAKMIRVIDQAKEDGNTVGGVFEVIVTGVPVGLGSYVMPDRRLDARLAGAMMGIQAIKGVEIGLGFEAATLPGSLVHDALFHDPARGVYRQTNGAGGIEGGISNGEPIVVRAAMKPIPTLYKPLPSFDLETKEAYLAAIERSDACAAPAAAVIGENVAAYVLAEAFCEKFGGDSIEEMKRNFASYQARVAERLR
ncbi:chorismate synthase [Ferroacidibacillus organovorans]|uniref:Chorismate synthase n=1 Tax=Ferroacidibacillus organovorans TaxID=1765683 RepID=A0A1V4EUD3_9BACL|nr:chorismate synthase [Ferroacidibacillus organovorans]OAG94741.1 chorismate synthase [Ferroacidibacillus organovorans]OPG16545.1 chorismate synthase [Ferroacidibacillus organovorans]